MSNPSIGDLVSITLEIGSPAPDFTLKDQHGQEVTLSSLRAHSAALLVFFPFAFSGICTGELREISDDLSTFEGAGVQVMGISCDPVHALRAWGAAEGYSFPLLSDFWPHGDVAQRYGAFFEPGGMATRATFLVDSEGILRWSVVNGPGEARDLAAYREALAAV